MYEGILREKTTPSLEFLEYVVYFALYSALMERFTRNWESFIRSATLLIARDTYVDMK